MATKRPLLKGSFILLDNKKGRIIVRPAYYEQFFKRKGMEIHCIGSRELCESLAKLYETNI